MGGVAVESRAESWTPAILLKCKWYLTMLRCGARRKGLISVFFPPVFLYGKNCDYPSRSGADAPQHPFWLPLGISGALKSAWRRWKCISSPMGWAMGFPSCQISSVGNLVLTHVLVLFLKYLLCAGWVRRSTAESLIIPSGSRKMSPCTTASFTLGKAHGERGRALSPWQQSLFSPFCHSPHPSPFYSYCSQVGAWEAGSDTEGHPQMDGKDPHFVHEILWWVRVKRNPVHRHRWTLKSSPLRGNLPPWVARSGSQLFLSSPFDNPQAMAIGQVPHGRVGPEQSWEPTAHHEGPQRNSKELIQQSLLLELVNLHMQIGPTPAKMY